MLAVHEDVSVTASMMEMDQGAATFFLGARPGSGSSCGRGLMASCAVDERHPRRVLQDPRRCSVIAAS